MRHTLLERAHQLRHYREHFTVLFSQRVAPAGVPGPDATALFWPAGPVARVGATPARASSSPGPLARRNATARLKFPLPAAPAWNPSAELEDRGARWTPDDEAALDTARTDWPAAPSVLDANELLDATVAALQTHEERPAPTPQGMDLEGGDRWLSPPLPPVEARPTVPDGAPLWIAEPDGPTTLAVPPDDRTAGAASAADTGQFNARTGQMTFRDLLAFNSGTGPTPEPPAAAAPAPLIAAPDPQAPSAAAPETPATPAGDMPMNHRAPPHPQQTLTPVPAQEPAGLPDLPGQPPAPAEPRRPDEPQAPPVAERRTVPEQPAPFTPEHGTAPEQTTAGVIQDPTLAAAPDGSRATAAGEADTPAQPAPPVAADVAFPSGPPLLDLSDPAFVPPADDPTTRERLQALLPPTSADARFSLPRRPRPVPLTPPRVQDAAPAAPLHSPEQVQSILARLNRQQESEAEGTPEMRALSIDEMLSWKRPATPEPTGQDRGGDPGKAAELGDPAEADDPDPGTPPAAQLDAELPLPEGTDVSPDRQDTGLPEPAGFPPAEGPALDDRPVGSGGNLPASFTANAEHALARALSPLEPDARTTTPGEAGRTEGLLPPPAVRITPTPTARPARGAPETPLDVRTADVEGTAGTPRPRLVPGLSAPAEGGSGTPASPEQVAARLENTVPAQLRRAAEASTPASGLQAPPEIAPPVESGRPVAPDMPVGPQAEGVPIPSTDQPVGLGASGPATMLEPTRPPTAPRNPAVPVEEVTVSPVRAEEAPAVAGTGTAAPLHEADPTVPPDRVQVQPLHDDVMATQMSPAALLAAAGGRATPTAGPPEEQHPGLGLALHAIFRPSGAAPDPHLPASSEGLPSPSPASVRAVITPVSEVAAPDTVLPELQPDTPEPAGSRPRPAVTPPDASAPAFTAPPAAPALRTDHPSTEPLQDSEVVRPVAPAAAPDSLQEPGGRRAPALLPELDRGGVRRVTAHLAGGPAPAPTPVPVAPGVGAAIPLARALDMQDVTVSETGRRPVGWSDGMPEGAVGRSTLPEPAGPAPSSDGSAAGVSLAAIREAGQAATETSPVDAAGEPAVTGPSHAQKVGASAPRWTAQVPALQPAPGASPRTRTVTEPALDARPRPRPRPVNPERSAQPRPVETGGVSALVQRALTNPSAREPLPLSVRDRLAPLLGADVPGVTLLRDAHAAAATAEAAADALAVGDAVLLSPGQDLASPRGLALLAHELTHVLRDRDPSFVPAVLRPAPRQPATAVPARRRAPMPTPVPARMDEETLAEHVEGRVQQALTVPPSEPSAGPAFRAASWPGLPAPWEPMPFWGAPSGADRPAGPARPVSVATPPSTPVGSPPPVGAPAVPVARAASTSRSVPAADGGGADGAGSAQRPAVGADRRQSQRAPDLDQLAQQVYRVLKRRLAAEVRRGR